MANVNVTYDEMNSAAGRLRTGQQTLTDTLTDLMLLTKTSTSVLRKHILMVLI